MKSFGNTGGNRGTGNPSVSPPSLSWTVGTGGDYATLESAIAAAKESWAKQITLALTDSSYTYDPSSESLQVDKPIIIEPATKNTWDALFYLSGFSIPSHDFSSKGSGVASFSSSENDITIVGSVSNPDFTGITGSIGIWDLGNAEFSLHNITSISSNVLTVDGTIPAVNVKTAIFFVPPTTITISSQIELGKYNDVSFSNLRLESSFFSDFFQIDEARVSLEDCYINSQFFLALSAISSFVLTSGNIISKDAFIEAKNCEIRSGNALIGTESFGDAISVDGCLLRGNFYSIDSDDTVIEAFDSTTNIFVYAQRESGSINKAIDLTRSKGFLRGEIRNANDAIFLRGGNDIKSTVSVVDCTSGYVADPASAGGNTVDVSSINSVSGTTTPYSPATSGVADTAGNVIFHP